MSYPTSIRYSPSRSPRIYSPLDPAAHQVRYIPLRHGSHGSPVAAGSVPPRRYSPIPHAGEDLPARSPTSPQDRLSSGPPRYEEAVDDEIRRLEADRRAWEAERDRVIADRQKRREEERREAELRYASRGEPVPEPAARGGVGYDHERDIEHRARESHEQSQQLDREIEEYYESERHRASGPGQAGQSEDPFRSHRWMELHQRLMRDRANWHRERQVDLDRIGIQIHNLQAERQALAKEREALAVARDAQRRELEVNRRAQAQWAQHRDAERRVLVAEREALLTGSEAQEADANARAAQLEHQQREIDEARAAIEADRRHVEDQRRQLHEERARFAEERERWEREHKRAAAAAQEEIRPKAEPAAEPAK